LGNPTKEISQCAKLKKIYRQYQLKPLTDCYEIHWITALSLSKNTVCFWTIFRRWM